MELIFTHQPNRYAEHYDISDKYLICIYSCYLLEENTSLYNLHELLPNNLSVYNTVTNTIKHACIPYVDCYIDMSISPTEKYVFFYCMEHLIIMEIETFNIILCIEEKIVSNIYWDGDILYYFIDCIGFGKYNLVKYNCELQHNTTAEYLEISFYNPHYHTPKHIYITNLNVNCIAYNVGKTYFSITTNSSMSELAEQFNSNILDLVPIFNNHVRCINNKLYYTVGCDNSNKHHKYHAINITNDNAISVEKKFVVIYNDFVINNKNIINNESCIYICKTSRPDDVWEYDIYYVDGEKHMKLRPYYHNNKYLARFKIINDIVIIKTSNNFYRINMKKYYDDIINLLCNYNISQELQHIIKKYL